MPEFDDRAFRDALSCFATGVTIVTTCDGAGEPVGMTASSFNSVSVDPPLVLWSVTKTAHAAQIFHDASHFAIHVLAADQVDLSNRFARRGEDKFGPTDFALDANNVPIIDGCSVRFDCKTWAVYEGGDHWVIIGEVQSLGSENKDGLVFSSGSYATAAPLRQPEPSDAPQSDDAAQVEGLLLYQLARAYRQLSGQLHSEVRKAGLSVSEWRVLASLHSTEARDLDDLSRRSFVRTDALLDMAKTMSDNGLCTILDEGGVTKVRGSAEAEARIDHLFKLGLELERQALAETDEDTEQALFATLRRVIKNTNS